MIKLYYNENHIEEIDNIKNGNELIKKLHAQGFKDVLAIKINNDLYDLDTMIPNDSKVEIIHKNHKYADIILKKTAAQILAHAVKNLFTDAKLACDSVNENGFYYDFFMPPVKENQLKKIENEMHKIVNMDQKITRQDFIYKDTISLFNDQPYKLEIIEELKNSGTLSVYKQDTFMDTCEGSIFPRTGYVKFFKLVQANYVYWKNNSSNVQLQRIYGIAFFSKEDLQQYLDILKIREERDHNTIGRKLNYFFTVNEIGQGLPLFTPKGTKLMQILRRFVEDEEEKRGYLLTMTPCLAKSDLYKISGHWDLYKKHMHIISVSDTEMALRPMTCPFQFYIYKNQIRSYKDLPIRYTETSTLFRNEDSGAMHGLIRIRQFTLADGHIICRFDQLKEEFFKVIDLLNFIMSKIGLKDVWFRFSKWDPEKRDKFIDNPKAWDESQKLMKELLDEMNIQYEEVDGEAAFYGPKLDLQIKNVYGKEDTVITVQLDFALPERFDMNYINNEGQLERPFIIHRSSIGCYERTVAFLLEQNGGKFPFWMSPTQVVIITISEKFLSYAEDIQSKLKNNEIRTVIDQSNETLSKKIRNAQQEYIPIMIIIGENEVNNNTITIRLLNNKKLNDISINEFIEKTVKMNKEKLLDYIF